MISVRGVTHQLAGQTIIDSVSLDIPGGKVTALIGPNGAGKSTLLNLIAGQQDLQSGVVTLEGRDLHGISPRDKARLLAVVAQQSGVASRLRLRDLVGFGRWPHHQGRPGPADAAAVTQALHDFELAGLADRFLDEVSGGQKQRAFLAMAHVQDTKWLLLDEPLNNLDIRHASSLMAHIQRLSRIDGKAVVIVIHDLNYALAGADHIVAIKAGRIAFEGPVNETTTPEALSALYDHPVQVFETAQGRFAHHHRSP